RRRARLAGGRCPRRPRQAVRLCHRLWRTRPTRTLSRPADAQEAVSDGWPQANAAKRAGGRQGITRLVSSYTVVPAPAGTHNHRPARTGAPTPTASGIQAPAFAAELGYPQVRPFIWWPKSDKSDFG